MNNGISQLSVRDVLGGADDYLIPMYQRNYAWGEAEITQLVQDLLDEMPKLLSDRSPKPYYIGTLVVFHRATSDTQSIYEVIDGQQRLTTLFLLASYLRLEARRNKSAELDWFSRPCVRFESRPISSETMQAAYDGIFAQGYTQLVHSYDYNCDITNGYELIQRVVPKLCLESDVKQKKFADYLFTYVQIMRVRVPDDTELNHYFEIMNNRGEQLEKHEVLKSRLMSNLDKEDHQVLHSVWEACCNMERYVQMGFPRSQRDQIFGSKNWGQFIPENFSELREILQSTTAAKVEQTLTMRQLVSKSPGADSKHGHLASKEEPPERFNTVVNFPNFLLQVLRASTGEDIPLDDKRLIIAFEDHVLRMPDATSRVKEFIYNLLKGKYLFDQYIIKREFMAGDDRWSLKRLKWQASNDSNDYVNTFGSEDADSYDNRRALMLLSALHVSTPTMVYKHWLNGALRFLFTNDERDCQSYISYLESMSRCFVYDRFLSKGDGLDYYDIIYKRNAKQKKKSWSKIDESKLTFGHIANNLVFNYLDYLLWMKYRRSSQLEAYEFSFRSSVEHFYPRNPMTFVGKLLAGPLNSFGNLCLISHSKNSRLSNLSPEAKKDYYRMGGIDSIKQWLMMKAPNWTQSEIEQHNADMVAVFAKDLSHSAER